jgi:hypothetical protein
MRLPRDGETLLVGGYTPPVATRRHTVWHRRTRSPHVTCGLQTHTATDLMAWLSEQLITITCPRSRGNFVATVAPYIDQSVLRDRIRGFADGRPSSPSPGREGLPNSSTLIKPQGYAVTPEAVPSGRS